MFNYANTNRQKEGRGCAFGSLTITPRQFAGKSMGRPFRSYGLNICRLCISVSCSSCALGWFKYGFNLSCISLAISSSRSCSPFSPVNLNKSVCALLTCAKVSQLLIILLIFQKALERLTFFVVCAMGLKFRG